MKRKFLYLFWVLFAAQSYTPIKAQHIFFRRLGISDGLNASSFWHTTIDKNGFIWMASLDGLFMYDGYIVQHFTRETHPQLPSNVIGRLECDSRNRIWIQTSNGVAMIDENRSLHHIKIPGYPVTESIDRMVFEAKGAGIVAITPMGAFLSKDGMSDWAPYTWLNNILKKNGVVDVRRFDDRSQLLCLRGKKVLLLDFKEQKILLDLPLPGAMGICRLNDDEILAGSNERWGLYRIHIKQKKIIKEYAAPPNKNGIPIQSAVVMIEKAADQRIYITTRRDGLIRYNPADETLDRFEYDMMDPHSISTNGLRMIAANDAGLLVISSPNGINFTNVTYPMLKQQLYFRDTKGNFFQTPVNGIITDRQNNMVLTTSTHVLRWNRETGTSTILRNLSLEENLPAPVIVPATPEIDSKGNAWIGYNGDGIMIYNQQNQLIKRLKKELPTAATRVLRNLNNGMMMVGAEDGLYMIDPVTYRIDTFAQHPALHKLSAKRIIDILPENNSVWLALSPNGGAFHYNFLTKKMKVYDASNGLSSNRTYCLASDKMGNIYAGTRDGLSIIDTNGRVTTIDKSNGLLNARIESMQTDDSGYVWFANNNNICRYDPWQKKLFYFSENNGISDISFGVESSHKSPSGELFFGTSKGLVFFQPKNIRVHHANLTLYIHRTLDGKNFIPCNKDSVLSFAYKEGKVMFQVSGSDLLSNQRIYYRYMLEGLDTGWSEPTHTRSIGYNLRPGNYRFLVQASYDRVNYIASGEPISLEVKKPFWQTWSFLSGVLLITGIALWLLYRLRFRSMQKKLRIQKQMAELEAKAIRAQMNPHFIFNSLNAIQESIVLNDYDTSYQYLSKFSKLLRLVLNNSEKNLIPLRDEIEMNRFYLELESLRFKHSFSYSIQIDEEIDPDTMLFPSLLLQPFIENAIWHGLMHKEGEKKLELSFHLSGESLQCIIEDNGVGREKAAAIKKQKLGGQYFESKGTALARQRLQLLQQTGLMKTTLLIADKQDTDGHSTGTRVTISIPLLEIQ